VRRLACKDKGLAIGVSKNERFEFSVLKKIKNGGYYVHDPPKYG